uniref:SCP domain-containing protein n=1 Tax=Macrostomum lignano TaxID=282301 RepID=A0A1I8HLS1_9PLAT
MTDAEHQGIVELHNRLRRSVLPEAANMNQLIASATLRNLAQQAADTCRFEHNYGGDYSGLGENLYMGGSNASLAVMLWFIERENYRLSASGTLCGLEYGNGRYPQYASSCGHYYQVVQASVREVGCGKKACSGSSLIVCEYNSGSGSPPYTAGPSCSGCSSARPRCLDGLCVPVGTSGSTCSLACKSCTKLVGNATGSCDCSGSYVPCTKCDSDATQCLNNGTDVGASLTNCSCVCPTDFYGDRCQYNRAQFASALQLRFGGELRSRSYFPVPKSFWPSLWRALEPPLLTAIADFCRWNFATCCPSASVFNSSDGGSGGNASILASSDLRLAASGINVSATGELTVSLVAPDSATTVFCGNGSEGSASGFAKFLSSPALIANLTAKRKS